VKVIESPVDFISIDQEKCVGCKNCAIICGMNLWKVSDGKARLASDYKKFCTECASCFTVCDTMPSISPSAARIWRCV